MVTINPSAFGPSAQRPTDFPPTWAAYNRAQVSEKDRFMELLADLCASVPQPEYQRGRPRLSIADMLFAATFKVYSGFSSRRFTGDLGIAHERGHIDKVPHFNSVSNYLSDPTLTPIIKGLIEASAMPMRNIETTFAADASGFSTSQFDRWVNRYSGKDMISRKWWKVHAMVGVQTNIVTAIEITPKDVNDYRMFTTLFDSTVERFQMNEVLADKGYFGESNLAHAAGQGVTPFIPFKKNTNGKGSPVWQQLYAYFMFHRDEFLAHYHKRSNVETTFSMVKMKFGPAVRAKSDSGQVNEILLKFLAHNVCQLIQAMERFGVNIAFR